MIRFYKCTSQKKRKAGIIIFLQMHTLSLKIIFVFPYYLAPVFGGKNRPAQWTHPHLRDGYNFRIQKPLMPIFDISGRRRRRPVKCFKL